MGERVDPGDTFAHTIEVVTAKDLHFAGGGQEDLHLGGGQQPCQGGGGRGDVHHPPVPHQDGQFEELKIVTVFKDNTYRSPFKHNDQGVYKYTL